MNPTGKIEIYHDRAYSITGEIPDNLREYLHIKVEPSIEYQHCSLVKHDRAAISREVHPPELARELEDLLNLWVARIASKAKCHKQKQFQLRRAYLKEKQKVLDSDDDDSPFLGFFENDD